MKLMHLAEPDRFSLSDPGVSRFVDRFWLIPDLLLQEGCRSHIIKAVLWSRIIPAEAITQIQ